MINWKYLAIVLLFIQIHYGQSQIELSLIPGKTNYIIGAEISLNFKTSRTLNSGAWVGLYDSARSRNSTKGYLTYKYIHDAQEIILTFRAPNDPGEYEFRIFDTKPEKEVASKTFKVIGIDPREIDVNIISENLTLGNTFEVQITTDLALSSTAWMGIYKSSAETSSSKGYLSYGYLKENDNILRMKAPMEVGSYELRLFNSNDGVLLKQVPFYIGELNLPGLDIQIQKDTYGPAEDIAIMYIGHEDLTDRSWLGIYPRKDDSRSVKGYLDYRYLKPKMKGTLFFKSPSEKGDYEVRMFYSDRGPMLLDAVPFSVTSSLDKTYLEKHMELEGRVVLYGIYFDTDKAVVKSESYALVEEISKLILADAELKVRIEGHTDAVGEEVYNQQLSEKRAKAISDLLISKYKVPSSKLETIGFGETKPLGDNNSASGRAKNRRVELVRI